MNLDQLLALYDQDQRIDVEYPDQDRQVLPKFIRHVNKSGHGRGTILYSSLTAADVDDAIHEQTAYFDAIGQDFEWKVYTHDSPPDLKERLAAAGFEIEDGEAIMVLDMQQAPKRLLLPISHDVRRILDPVGLEDVRAVEEAVWEEDQSDLIHYLAQTLRDQPDQLSVYVAYIADLPASAAWAFYPPNSQFASLWGGSTLEAYRGKGLYGALLAARLQQAAARGVSYLTVDASPMSRPILERFGFIHISTAYECNWRARKQT